MSSVSSLRFRTPRRQAAARSRGLSAALAVALPAVLLAAGCSGGETSEPEPALSTPLASYDTSTAVVTRAPLCDQVAPDALQEAVGDVPEPTEWKDGDRIEVGPTEDVVQEYGCAWDGKDARARAWVLAPPVTAGLARRLVRERPERDCRLLPHADDFGSPSRALVCDDGTVRYTGLFGDAWLTCELTTRRADPDLAGRWCVAVAVAASK